MQLNKQYVLRFIMRTIEKHVLGLTLCDFIKQEKPPGKVNLAGESPRLSWSHEDMIPRDRTLVNANGA